MQPKDDGLTATSNISFNDKGYMIVNNTEVEEIIELRDLVKFLRMNIHLWEKSRLLLQEKQYLSRSSAPIISISFDKAIDIIINDNKLKSQSLFRLDKEYSENKIGGTLYANFYKDKNKINFQLWQIYHINDEYINIPTYYVHGIYDINKKYFIHFDGALINHNKEYRLLIEQGIIPPKDADYYKIFRLDGIITKQEAKEMMSNYLTIDELNNEFMELEYQEFNLQKIAEHF